MDNSVIESPKVEDEEEIAKQENDTETELAAGPTSIEAPPTIDYEAKKIARDAKAKRKDEKTVQQVLKSLDGIKTPQEKLSAMCKKYSELLHENRQLQATVKQSEKNINLMHREKEQFRHERSKAVLAKIRMEQLCRELQKLNKAQLEETALKLRVEEEKRKEICLTFQSAFAEMNTLTNQSNEKSAKMREENLEMREKIKSVREGIELTEAQLDKVRQQSRLELELAEKKHLRATLELTAEKEALMEDKRQLLMKLAKYHVLIKEHEGREQFLRKQIKIYQEKFEEFKRDVKMTIEFLKNFRPESKEMRKKMLRLEKETALWKQRWEKINAAVGQMADIKDKRDTEVTTLTNKLSTLQELCKVFQRERASLIAQLREKNEGSAQVVDRKALADDNRKAVKQFEIISKECEKLKDNLPKLEDSLSEVVRDVFRSTVYDDESNESAKVNKKMSKKMKNEARKKSNKQREEASVAFVASSDHEVEPSNDSQSDKSDKTSNTIEMSAIEASDAEIAILERHELVLKDIEKVLAEQAILEAKIACVKEMGKSLADTDDPKSPVTVDNDVTIISEVPREEEARASLIVTSSEPSEVLEFSETPRNAENLSLQNEKISDSEAKSRVLDVSAIEPEPASCEPELLGINVEIRIPSSGMVESVEESGNIVPSDPDPRPVEACSMKNEPSIVQVEAEHVDESAEKTNAEPSVVAASLRDIEDHPKVDEDLVSASEVTTDKKIDPSSTRPLSGTRDNAIEA